MTEEIKKELKKIYTLCKASDLETKLLGCNLFFKSKFINQHKGNLEFLYFYCSTSISYNKNCISYKYLRNNRYLVNSIIRSLLDNNIQILFKSKIICQ